MDEFAHLRRFSQARVNDRNMDELIGISRGLIADGQIVQAEAEFLLRWIEQASSMGEDPIFKMMVSRIGDMMEDGVLDQDESAELLQMLQALTGEDGKIHHYKRPSDLPLDNPLPDISIADRGFVFTGVMAYGPRKECQQLVADLGGFSKGGPSKKVNYLVIGTIANEHWLYSSYGRKIQRAVELRDQGHNIAIVNEDHFMRFAL
ncbi:hypothetical protein SAMN05216571_101234 [Onishia taeanensis]|uniref:BRCA1 C Terminus (BRCT) domain-containing protein n=1 Tax=Onishia taeanensis TaxID=284577 RepID=A0A1G7N5D5_9GAMM|nr:BRCT domain-containing protein [Halomonas taeanensis]SDF69151.1 hypothetical protein SAMN05216571_101234 [Halomonas taeanensis]